ncbi:MAG: ArsR/SmtB family transcription factor [Kordiimonas sp.]
MDTIFKALADETRRLMLDRLLGRPGLTLTELIAGMDMKRQSVSKHLKILEGADLIVVEWRGREKLHYLNPVPIQQISRRWVDKFSRHKVDAVLSLKEALEEEKEG